MKHYWFWIVPLVLALALVIWLWWSNVSLVTTCHTVVCPELPSDFSGIRILQISDMHNCRYGKDNIRLVEAVSRQKPDIIVVTGDLIDSRNTNTEIALDFLREAVKISPVYYVPGNHEARLDIYEGFRQQLEDIGVTVLENQKCSLMLQQAHITLMGIPDPSFAEDYDESYREGIADAALNDLCSDTDGFRILLSHRAELFDIYVKHGCRLVFTGHAHGGHVRLPLIGGLFAPGQGFFPRYDAGIFQEGETTMVVSRGLGDQIIIPRVFNRPELVLVELIHGDTP